MQMLEDNGYKAKMLCDSISPDGVRLSTMEVTFPRIVLAEFNTHRMFSRNSASSRAIPVEKQLKKITDKPFIPIYWGKNQKGMQADQELDELQQQQAIDFWKEACTHAIDLAQSLMNIGVHKQITNRLLEPFMWHTVIVSATEWDNFFALRCHRDAQPEIRYIAILMQQLLTLSQPNKLGYYDWHLPLVQPNELDWIKENSIKNYEETMNAWKKISVGRCARVSYLTHDGRRDPEADIKLCDDLRLNGHMSPFEHVARPMSCGDTEVLKENIYLDNRMTVFPSKTFLGNFRGWIQFRKTLPHEHNYGSINK